MRDERRAKADLTVEVQALRRRLADIEATAGGWREDAMPICLERLMSAEKRAILGTLVTGCAHDLNNPNSVIMLNAPVLETLWIGTLDLLAEAGLGDECVAGRMSVQEARVHVAQFLADIRDASARIKNIVLDLKDYARQASEADMVPLDLSEAVHRASSLIESRIRKATDRCRVTLADGALRIRGNRLQLAQMTIALIDNACEALPKRECAIAISTFREDEPACAALRIEDEGIGMTPDALSRIGDPFFTTKRDRGGMGLGLCIAADIARAHGGAMSVESGSERGISVTVRLPLCAVESKAESGEEHSA